MTAFGIALLIVAAAYAWEYRGEIFGSEAGGGRRSVRVPAAGRLDGTGRARHRRGDRVAVTVELASVFAKLRYGAAPDFSMLMSPFECALLLQAVGDELVEDLDRRARRGDRLIEALARATEWLVFAEGAEITVGPEDAATLAELVPLEGQS